jgi:hypothetical protein
MVWKAELEYTPPLQPQSPREVGVTRPREFQVFVNNVHSEHLCFWKKLSQSRGPLTRSATGVENSRVCRYRIATNEGNFLRPNCSRLRIQSSHHGLVSHLLSLRVEVGHGASPECLARMSG